MKKIFSLLLVVSMLFAMMISVNASYTMGFTASTSTVKVGETFDVVLNINLADGSTCSGGSITLAYDSTYATLKEINTGSMTAGATNWTDLATAKAQKTFTTALTESGTFCVATFEAIAPTEAFVVSAGTVSFTFRNPTVREQTVANVGTATITIKAAEAEKELVAADEDKEALTAETIDGYTNHAIYVYEFAAPELAEGESLNHYGFKIADQTEQPATISAAINGTVKYVLAIVGIGEDTAEVKHFYNVSRWVEAE